MDPADYKKQLTAALVQLATGAGRSWISEPGSANAEYLLAMVLGRAEHCAGLRQSPATAGELHGACASMDSRRRRDACYESLSAEQRCVSAGGGLLGAGAV